MLDIFPLWSSLEINRPGCRPKSPRPGRGHERTCHESGRKPGFVTRFATGRPNGNWPTPHTEQATHRAWRWLGQSVVVHAGMHSTEWMERMVCSVPPVTRTALDLWPRPTPNHERTSTRNEFGKAALTYKTLITGQPDIYLHKLHNPYTPYAYKITSYWPSEWVSKV